jgi:hypothetical protein
VYAQECDGRDEDPEATVWWRWVSGYMREVGRMFHADVKPLQSAMDALVFSGSSGVVPDARVLALWYSLKALYVRM